MKNFRLKIRGIYTTALTRFFLDHGHTVVSPSDVAAERFSGEKNLIPGFGFADVEIQDRDDGQGIVLNGEPESVAVVVALLQEAFWDVVCRPPEQEDAVLDLEFPGSAKFALDEIRRRVMPTVFGHHRLRTIHSGRLDDVEERIAPGRPEEEVRAGRDLIRELVWETLEKGKTVAIEHVKIDGRRIRLSPGEIMETSPDHGRLVLRRGAFMGRSVYDGLEIPKEEGDYAITEAMEGSWSYTHAYYRRDSSPVGTYQNVNTPLELYPDRIRYVDLEVDVVRVSGEAARIVDEELLSELVKGGRITTKLARKALETARRLLNRC